MSFETGSGSSIKLGRGKFLFDRGNTGAFAQMGNVSAATIEIADDRIQKRSSMDTTNGLLAEDTKSRDVNLKLTADYHTLQNVALALMGDTGEYTQASATVTDQALSDVVLGAVYYVGKREISAVNISKVSAPSTPLTAGTDFEVFDAEAGLIRIIGGAIAELDDLLVDYTAAAITAGSGRKTVAGATQSRIEGAVKFLANNVRGGNDDADFWRVSVGPEGEYALISEDYGEFSLTLAVLNDAANHPSEPYFKLTRRP